MWLFACTEPVARVADPPGAGTVVDTVPDPPDSETDPEPLEVGDFCDPDADLCPEGSACCVPCCIPDFPAVCTTLDEFGECPLPDLSVDAEALAADIQLGVEDFEEDSCAVIEGCVQAPGERKVLRFTTVTPNLGTADAVLGFPEDRPDLFEWSECHGHWHFSDFSAYELVDEAGGTLPAGRKQAFCLMDAVPPEEGGIPVYNCGYQGISVGWADSYPYSFDCQFVDVTDVAPGRYTLRVLLDPEGVMLDKDESDDFGEVVVDIE